MIFNFDHLSLSTRRKIAYFESKDIETTIQNYYFEFKNWFVIFWCNKHQFNWSSSFPANCKKTSKLSHSLEYKFYLQYFKSLLMGIINAIGLDVYQMKEGLK